MIGKLRIIVKPLNVSHFLKISMMTCMFSLILVFGTETMYFSTMVSQHYKYVTIFIMLTSLVCLTYMYSKANIKLFETRFLLFACLSIILIISSLFNKASITTTVLQLILFTLSFLAATVLPPNKVMLSVVYLVSFLAAFSVVAFILHPVLMNVNFPTFRNISGYEFKSYIFSITLVSDTVMQRLYGVFWEPGVFQIYINLSLLLLLFFIDVKQKKYLIIVLLVALFFTFSTSGYAVGVITITTYLVYLYLTRKNRKYLYWLLAGFLAGVILFTIGWYLNVEFVHQLVLKFNPESSMAVSLSSRLQSISINSRIINDNLLLGVGPENTSMLFDYYTNNLTSISNTNTIFTFGSFYGIIFLLLISCALIKNAVSVGKHWLIQALIIITGIIQLFSEPLVYSLLLHYFLFLPAKPVKFINLSRFS